ncbi:MAG TPA: phage portal protein [Kaistia sp.]|nr:phage portal protein [Kaistia sp.]
MWPFSRPVPVVASETKSLAAPDAELLAIFGAATSDFAVGLSRALTVPAVQRAIALIAGSIAAFPILVERREGGAWKSDAEHPVAALFDAGPNEWSSTFDLVRDVIATALTHDQGGLAWVNRLDGRAIEIVRYEPAHYAVTFSTDGRQEPAFAINNRPALAADVIYLRSPFGRSPLSLAADAIGVAKAMEVHAGNLFSRGARPSGVIEAPKTLGDEGLKRMKAGWQAAHGGAENAGRTAILWDGATFRPLTFSSTDAQFLELRKEQVVEIARAFGVPPSMLYEMSRATWSNSEQAAKEWLAALELWMQPLEGAMRRALFSAEERPDWRVRFDRDDFSAVDLTARATAINGLIASRTLSPNEGRGWLDMPPRAGGDVYENPNTGASQPGTAPALADEA